MCRPHRAHRGLDRGAQAAGAPCAHQQRVTGCRLQAGHRGIHTLQQRHVAAAHCEQGYAGGAGRSGMCVSSARSSRTAATHACTCYTHPPTHRPASAEVTMADWAAWRNTSRRSTTGTSLEAIRPCSTAPGPARERAGRGAAAACSRGPGLEPQGCDLHRSVCPPAPRPPITLAVPCPLTHGRQLIHISHQHQLALGLQCVYQGGGQGQRQHRRLIHQHRVSGQRVAPAAGRAQGRGAESWVSGRAGESEPCVRQGRLGSTPAAGVALLQPCPALHPPTTAHLLYLNAPCVPSPASSDAASASRSPLRRGW